MQYLKNTFTFLMLCATLLTCQQQEKTQEVEYVYVPKITSDWWPIANNPDIGTCTSKKQQPVDFGIWQAADGTWQLWSCIRHTNCGEKTRLFHAWEGKSITDTLWIPKGIVMQADTTLGETSGGLQAPHVIMKDGLYHMLYGAWDQICLATSTDGKNFERYQNEAGKPQLFKIEAQDWINTRDAMTIKVDDTYYTYYTVHKAKQDSTTLNAAIFSRTSKDLIQWENEKMVSAGGSVADLDFWYGGDAECPFVVQIEDKFVLFRNQRYIGKQINTQYCSPNPLDFGVDSDKYKVGQLSVAAPEIILHEGQYYIAALNPDLDGIRMAKIDFRKEYINR